MDVRDMLQGFLETIDSPHTKRAYGTDIRAFVGHADDVRSVAPADVGAFIRDLQSQGSATSTVRRRLSAIRAFYDWLVANNLMETNPARTYRANLSTPSSGGSSGSQSENSVRTLSKAETERLVRATAQAEDSAVRDRGLILTVVYGALRRAELAAMNAEHVRPLGRHWVIDIPPGETWSAVYVRVPDVLVEVLDAVQAAYSIEDGALWRSLSNRNRGERMTPDGIYKAVQRTAARAGINDVDVETLRHTGLRLAAEAGASLQQVQTHARLQHVSSAEKYAPESSTGRLGERAMDFVTLDVNPSDSETDE